MDMGLSGGAKGLMQLNLLKEGMALQVTSDAAIAQLGEHSTEDRKVPGSKPGCGILFSP